MTRNIYSDRYYILQIKVTSQSKYTVIRLQIHNRFKSFNASIVPDRVLFIIRRRGADTKAEYLRPFTGELCMTNFCLSIGFAQVFNIP